MADGKNPMRSLIAGSAVTLVLACGSTGLVCYGIGYSDGRAVGERAGADAMVGAIARAVQSEPTGG